MSSYARGISCCSPRTYGKVFSERWARRDARRYRRRGLDAAGRRIVDFLLAQGVEERSVIEIGGGIGAVGIELARSGAERVVEVELSPGYEAPARELLRERGVEGRVERVLADFAAGTTAVEPADDVVLHRSVCCYPDVEALVGRAAGHARRHLVLSYPRDALWTRIAFRACDVAIGLLMTRGFRTYVRPAADVLGPALERGFRVAYEHRGPVWQVAALERSA